jgi:hypothetical protein
MSELSELFDRDPLLHSEQDIVAIVARIREAQAQYELGAKAPVAPRAKKSKTVDLLKDLGLGGSAPGPSSGSDLLKDLGFK